MAITIERAQLLAADREKMTYEEAEHIHEIAEVFRHQIGGQPGITVSDRIAAHFHVSVGEGLHLRSLASREISLGPPCAHCKGSGRVPSHASNIPLGSS